MQAEREVVRFLSAYQTIWHAHFPSLFRRAQWHIVTHLCTQGREGAAVGELYGLVKQVFCSMTRRSRSAFSRLRNCSSAWSIPRTQRCLLVRLSFRQQRCLTFSIII